MPRKREHLGDERVVVLEDSAVSRSRVDYRVPRSGIRRAMSAERLLSTIRSWSPLATRTGWVIVDRSSGALRPAPRIASQLREAGLNRDGLVAVLRAFLEAAEVVGGGALAFRGAREEEEVPGILSV